MSWTLSSSFQCFSAEPNSFFLDTGSQKRRTKSKGCLPSLPSSNVFQFQDSFLGKFPDSRGGNDIELDAGKYNIIFNGYNRIEFLCERDVAEENHSNCWSNSVHSSALSPSTTMGGGDLMLAIRDEDKGS